jgi:hypothetical protein
VQHQLPLVPSQRTWLGMSLNKGCPIPVLLGTRDRDKGISRFPLPYEAALSAQCKSLNHDWVIVCLGSFLGCKESMIVSSNPKTTGLALADAQTCGNFSNRKTIGK